METLSIDPKNFSASNERASTFGLQDELSPLIGQHLFFWSLNDSGDYLYGGSRGSDTILISYFHADGIQKWRVEIEMPFGELTRLHPEIRSDMIIVRGDFRSIPEIKWWITKTGVLLNKGKHF